MKKNWYQSKTVWGIILAVAGYFVYEPAIAIGLGIAGFGFRDALK